MAANNLSRLSQANFADSLIGPATQAALRSLNESMARSVQHAIALALASFAVSIEVPRPPGIDAAISAISEHITASLPTQDLLASFGQEWAASIGMTLAAAGVDLTPTINAIESARRVEPVSTGG